MQEVWVGLPAENNNHGDDVTQSYLFCFVFCLLYFYFYADMVEGAQQLAWKVHTVTDVPFLVLRAIPLRHYHPFVIISIVIGYGKYAEADLRKKACTQA